MMIVRDEHYCSGRCYDVLILILGGMEGRVLGRVRKEKLIFKLGASRLAELSTFVYAWKF